MNFNKKNKKKIYNTDITKATICELDKSLFKTYPDSNSYDDIYDYYFGPSRIKEMNRIDEEVKFYVEKIKKIEEKKQRDKMYKFWNMSNDNFNNKDDKCKNDNN
jgi:hypothetical protein